jgi:hypothetical protein
MIRPPEMQSSIAISGDAWAGCGERERIAETAI